MKKLLKITLTLFFITIIVLGFALPLNPAGNWYQQFLPNLNGRSIRDITFTDSLNGFAITSFANDTAGILRTTNSGDNWFYCFKDTGIADFYKIQFINQNTGFVGGYIHRTNLLKTTNAGINWFFINSAFDVIALDMFVLNQDTIWLVDNGSLTGGVFRTTNGGTNWTQQLNLGSLNPNKIYMFNSRIGFITEEGGGTRYVRKTTDGGFNWTQITTNDDYLHIYFVDSLTGWKSSVFGFKKTTNGGMNWVTQTVPSGGIIQTGFIGPFYAFNRDTLYGTGGLAMYPNSQLRGIIYRTTNGGDNWLFQVPDTSIHIIGYSSIQFVNKKNGWLYNYSTSTGIHTTNGGDTAFFVGVQQTSTEVPVKFKLHQNYPNPFNPTTNIKYQILNSSYINVIVYDISGRQIVDLVNQKQSAGTYEVDFNGNEYSSGIYFYSLVVNGLLSDVKKMILLK